MVLAQKVSLAFKKGESGDKFLLGGGVVNALTAAAATPDNPFINLPVPVAELNAVNKALTKAAAEALTGAYTAIDALEIAVKDWDKKFVRTANYVSLVAALSESPALVIYKAGFKPTKDTSAPSPLPAASDTYRVRNGKKKGAIVLDNQKRIDHAQGYVFATVPDGVIVEFEEKAMRITIGEKTIYIAVHTRLKIELSNLPQVPVNSFVYGFNAAGSGPACTPVRITPGVIHN